MTHGHAGAVVGSESELLAVALPYLDAGLRAGDLVALACPPDTVALVVRELGARAAVIESEPRLNLLGSRGPDALTMCERYLERAATHGSGRFRVLSEVDYGDDPADWREGQRFECVTNRMLGSRSIEIVCMYDRRRLDASVVDSVRFTHPVLVDHRGRPASNADYQDPERCIRSLPAPRDAVEDTAPALVVDDARTLAGLRHQVGAAIAALVPDQDQREDLYLAAGEIAANAFRHGTPPVSARVWSSGDRIVCVITDRGTAYADPFAGFLPAHGLDLSQGGMGLWLARKLWDHVDLLPGPAGLSVRLSARLR
jgi:anti-sigma regulatory factor (Ser/Thr protein kinase)